MRTKTEIKNSITGPFIANPDIIAAYDLVPGNTFEQEFSSVSIENIIFEVIAFAIFILEGLWDIFKKEQETAQAKQKIHSREWYRQKALDFKYGIPLIADSDQYDLTNYSADQIAAASVIKQAACVKLISSAGYGILRVKVATSDANGDLLPLPEAQFTALKYYMLRNVVDAGTQLKTTTGPADDLKLKMDVYYDPLVLSPTGARLDGTNATPVQSEIVSFLKSIDFNGSLVLSDLETKLRTIEGVKLAVVKEAFSRYGQYAYDTQNIPNVGLIDEIRIADSGYMKLDNDVLVINYKLINE